jgi:hypothetical protein
MDQALSLQDFCSLKLMLTDYTCEVLDLSNPTVFRDLSKVCEILFVEFGVSCVMISHWKSAFPFLE